MDWKQSLDKYLTTPPDDGFDGWTESVFGNHISDEFYAKNEKWLDQYDGQFNKWLNKLYNKGTLPEVAAKIIERAHKLYKL